jgi:hypothetical protein
LFKLTFFFIGLVVMGSWWKAHALGPMVHQACAWVIGAIVEDI